MSSERKHIEKTCEILVKRKHNDCVNYAFLDGVAYIRFGPLKFKDAEKIEPFEPTLIGIKQSHSLEDYLMIEHPTLWEESQDITCTWHNNSVGHEI